MILEVGDVLLVHVTDPYRNNRLNNFIRNGDVIEALGLSRGIGVCLTSPRSTVPFCIFRDRSTRGARNSGVDFERLV